ncbi:MAG: hypothetical protein ACQPRH_02400 [Solitalea-like symbiont of Tyrophagus putrescentiae]
MLLSNIPGNSDVKKNLIERVSNNMPATKLLFIDKDGYGSLALAIAYSKYLSCTEKTESDSCDKCQNCKKYNDLSHPDLHFSYPFFPNKSKNINYSLDLIDTWNNMVLKNPFININNWSCALEAKNNSLLIPSSECINKINILALKPYQSLYKILIIWHAEYLLKNANILLKLIEDSNTNTIIIATSSSKENLLPTFASRLESLYLKPADKQDLTYYATKLYQNKTADTIEQAISLANGSISKLTDYLNKQDDNLYIEDWLRLCYKGDIPKLIKFVEYINMHNKEFQKYILYRILDILKEGIKHKYIIGYQLSQSKESQFISNFIKLFDIDKLNTTYNIINEAILDLDKNINTKILFLDVSLSLNKILKDN